MHFYKYLNFWMLTKIMKRPTRNIWQTKNGIIFKHVAYILYLLF